MKLWQSIGIAILCISVIGIAVFFGYRQAMQPDIADGQTIEKPATIKVDVGDVQKTVIAPGQVVNFQEVTVSSKVNSTVDEIYVRPGDRVKKGDLLMSLADSTVQQEVAEAELAVSQAELDVNPEAVLQKIRQAQIGVDQAKLDHDEAVKRLDEMRNWEPDPAKVELAEAELKAAKGRYQSAVATDSRSSFTAQSAELRLQQAQVGLAEAQKQYDAAWNEARDWEQFSDQSTCLSGQGNGTPCTGPPQKQQLRFDRESTQQGLKAARNALKQAEIDYNGALAGVNYGGATAAESGIVSAQQTLERELNGPTHREVEEVKARVEAARLRLERAEIDLKVAQNNRAAELRLEQAKLALGKVQSALDATMIQAPIDSVVAKVHNSVGDTVAPGMTLIKLIGSDQHEVQVSVIEEDLPLMRVGQKVDLFFDAYPDLDVSGTVSRIVPERIQGSDRPLYHVYISVADWPVGVISDMTADASIILEGEENVLRIPRSLLSARPGGKGVVKVWIDNQVEERTVDVGIRGDSYVEILTGLEAGDEVVGQ